MSREVYEVYILLLDSQSNLKNISGNNISGSPCQDGLKQLPVSKTLQHLSYVTSPHRTLHSNNAFQKSKVSTASGCQLMPEAGLKACSYCVSSNGVPPLSSREGTPLSDQGDAATTSCCSQA